MDNELAKWELGLLLRARYELRKTGHELNYQDDKRVEDLRRHLDSQSEAKPEVETASKAEIPF